MTDAITGDLVARRALALADAGGPTSEGGGGGLPPLPAGSSAPPIAARTGRRGGSSAVTAPVQTTGSAPGGDDAVGQLVTLADGDRDVLTAARNELVRRLHADTADFTATTALGLVNQAVARLGWRDPYDWKIRWSQRFKRP